MYRSPVQKEGAQAGEIDPLLALGVNPKIVQEMLGHTEISMTMDIYSHVLPTMQKEAMHKMNTALWG
jgi:site-specific recombinase XerD